MRPLETAVCYDCRLFYFHKASGTFQWDQQAQKLVDGTVVYLPPGSTVAVDGPTALPGWESTASATIFLRR